jgi:hypothetical protein
MSVQYMWFILWLASFVGERNIIMGTLTMFLASVYVCVL